MNENSIVLDASRLSSMFVGKLIVIEHSGNPYIRDVSGACIGFTDIPNCDEHSNGGVCIIMKNGSRYGYEPKTLTEGCLVTGKINKFTPGCRTIRLAKMTKEEVKKV